MMTLTRILWKQKFTIIRMRCKLHCFMKVLFFYKILFRYKYIWKKTSEDIKNGVYRYAGTLFHLNFVSYHLVDVIAYNL